MAGGYCFFNNAAIAAQAIVRATGERVAILDVDFHHGNGTQQIFWRRGDVLYASLHADPERQYPFFLGARRRDRRGAGQRREPEPAAAGRHRRRRPTSRRSTAALAAIAATPGYVIVVSLGFDTYGHDPIGDFALTTAVYHEMGRRVGGARPAARDPPGGRLPPAVARRERPGLAARRRGPAVRAAAGGRVRRRRLGSLSERPAGRPAYHPAP